MTYKIGDRVRVLPSAVSHYVAQKVVGQAATVTEDAHEGLYPVGPYITIATDDPSDGWGKDGRSWYIRVSDLTPDLAPAFGQESFAPIQFSINGPKDLGPVRQFDTGATRSSEEGKPHYSGYIGWHALQLFGAYMLAHEIQGDGRKREPGNWKRGIPLDSYRDSLVRHVVDFNVAWEAGQWDVVTNLACAIWFNIQGILEDRTHDTP